MLNSYDLLQKEQRSVLNILYGAYVLQSDASISSDSSLVDRKKAEELSGKKAPQFLSDSVSSVSDRS